VQNLRRFLIVLSVVANIAFVSGYCYRTFWAHPTRFVPLKVYGQALRQLQLSKEQKSRLSSSMKEASVQIAGLRDQIRKHRLEIVDLLASAHPNPETIELKRREIASLQQEIQKLILKRILENKEVLSADQQERLFAYLKSSVQEGMKGGD
jgi:Spy/CpxP family protein refolding chaperone